MKRLFTLILVAAFASNAFAWSTVGHKIVVAIAQRHLTEKAKANIAKYMDYDIKKDAVWMDKHRNDEPIAYTTHYHVFATDKSLRYDPNYRLGKGDVVYALALSDYNLGNGNYHNLTDSAVVFNIRMIIHFMGDMHCPVHTHVEGVTTTWKCRLKGEEWVKIHGIYDKIPAWLYDHQNLSYDQIAESLDVLSKREIKKVTSGELLDWANDAASQSVKIYQINPMYTYELDDDTVEKSREIIDTQLRNAGYRLAAKLNEYFNQ